MRRTTLTALAAAALLLAGCGTQGDGGGSGKAPSPAPCTDHVQLEAADSGRTVCVTRGGEVRVTLDGTRERPWKPLTVTGTVLEPINAGFVILPGDATAAYQAVTAGKATLTSTRPLCARPTAPGQVACKGIQEWTVLVTVKA